MASCADCRFWFVEHAWTHHDTLTDKPLHRIAYCRRYPPPKRDTQPQTRDFDWCGEWSEETLVRKVRRALEAPESVASPPP